MRVKDIIRKDHPTLYIDELATKARATIRDQNVRVLPIIDANKRLVGVVSRSNVMTVTSSVSPIRVKGIMSKPKFIATLEMEANTAVRKMIESDEWYVPVANSTQDNTYVGVLGLENFMKASLEQHTKKLTRPLSEIMSTKVLTCTPEDEIDKIWRLMQKKSITGLPVVKKNKLIGIITQKDLLDSGSIKLSFEASKGQFKAPPKVVSIMKTPAITLHPDSTILEAAQLMLKRDFGRMPIKEKEDRLVGIVDREDIVKVML